MMPYQGKIKLLLFLLCFPPYTIVIHMHFTEIVPAGVCWSRMRQRRLSVTAWRIAAASKFRTLQRPVYLPLV